MTVQRQLPGGVHQAVQVVGAPSLHRNLHYPAGVRAVGEEPFDGSLDLDRLANPPRSPERMQAAGRQMGQDPGSVGR